VDPGEELTALPIPLVEFLDPLCSRVGKIRKWRGEKLKPKSNLCSTIKSKDSEAQRKRSG